MPQGNGMVIGGLSPLSETLWREKIDTEFIGDVSARLAWKDLTVMVTLSNGETQNVLDSLIGYAEPGTFTALMGPSGSGKSSLLDSLASHRAANAFLSGNIYLNGRIQMLSYGTANSDESRCRKGSKKRKVDVDPMIEAMYNASKLIAAEFVSSTKVIAAEFASSTRLLIAAESLKLEKK
ncbi:ABC transporter G family member 11-like [Apium graveolens]|uniref:ABC transporter G family member 11-like n=1 Tax=Apium graveolens TaxID=4045 RepID=UPI003D78E4BE